MNDLGLAARLRAILGAHVVRGVDAPPNISLCVGEAEGKVRQFHRLYRGRSIAMRTRSDGRLLRAALANLDAFLPDPGGTIRLGGRVLVREGRAVAVDSRLGFALERLERRLERDGWRMADVPGIPLDRETLEVFLRPPRLELDAHELATVEHELPSDEPEVALGAGRLPLHEVLVWRTDPDGDWSDARTLMALTQMVATSERVDEAALVLARRLLDLGKVRACPNDDAAFLAALRAESALS